MSELNIVIENEEYRLFIKRNDQGELVFDVDAINPDNTPWRGTLFSADPQRFEAHLKALLAAQV